MGVPLCITKWGDGHYFIIYGLSNTEVLVSENIYFQGDVIRTKSTETLPFPLILSGTIVTFLWLLYGVIIENPFIQVSLIYISMFLSSVFNPLISVSILHYLMLQATVTASISLCKTRKDLKNGAFWDVTPCGSCKNRRFEGTWRHLHQGDKNRWTRSNTSCN
jgi:uncharacterized protein with PQ loop repeat